MVSFELKPDSRDIWLTSSFTSVLIDVGIPTCDFVLLHISYILVPVDTPYMLVVLRYLQVFI
jgi:hypothetical protein